MASVAHYHQQSSGTWSRCQSETSHGLGVINPLIPVKWLADGFPGNSWWWGGHLVPQAKQQMMYKHTWDTEMTVYRVKNEPTSQETPSSVPSSLTHRR